MRTKALNMILQLNSNTVSVRIKALRIIIKLKYSFGEKKGFEDYD